MVSKIIKAMRTINLVEYKWNTNNERQSTN